MPPSPPVFVRNQGQFATDALYVAEFPGMLVRVQHGAILLQLSGSTDRREGVLVRMTFEGASPTHEVVGEDRHDTVYSYFLGNDSERWHRDVGGFGAVRLRGLYEGVDLVLRDEGGIPKYDVYLEPGADVSQIVVRVDGVSGAKVAGGGTLELDTAIGTLLQPQSLAWQFSSTGDKSWIPCNYRLIDEMRFGFDVKGRDPTRALVIDPGLVWSTYLGSAYGVSDYAWCVDIADDGEVSVAGNAAALDFPTTPGAFHVVGTVGWHIFVTKMRASDGVLLYSALIGGDGYDGRPTALWADAAGRTTVAGWTQSANFPTTPNAYDHTLDTLLQTDAVVFRFNASGTDLEYSTYLGSSSLDRATGVAVTSSGATIVAGYGGSIDFPVTPGAYQSSYSGQVGFVTKIAPAGNYLEWSATLGAGINVNDLALDAQDQVTVAGVCGNANSFPGVQYSLLQFPLPHSDGNVFVARLSSDGSALSWCAIFGGYRGDVCNSLALDSLGNAYVCGYTLSHDFPVSATAYQTSFGPQPNYIDAFAACLNSTGTALVYGTYLGGSGTDEAFGITVDPSGVATVCGLNTSTMTATPGAYDTLNVWDIFVTRLAPDGSRRIYSTFVGGGSVDEGFGIAANALGRVAVCGASYGPGYPTTPGVVGPTYNGGQSDAVVSVLDLYPQGVVPYGVATRSCLGPLQLQTSAMPATSASEFSLLCSAAPPDTTGWLLVSSAAATSPITRVGADLWIDPGQLVERIAVTSDAKGFVEQPMPTLLHTSGYRYYAQFVFRGNCTSSNGWSASNALEITVQ